jgi:hypothetical protein
MAFYVSVTNGNRKLLALGPFDRHGDALAEVDRVRRFVVDRDRDGWTYQFGTARHPSARAAGVLNRLLGFSPARDSEVCR